MSDLEEKIILKCIKEKNKLRVKIISNGYYNDANCQFPKDIRIEGRYFRVKPENIQLITRTNKWFYSIKKNNIEILENYIEEELLNSDYLSKLNIYEDETNNDCCICLDADKDCVFIPCGHYYCCMNCAKLIDKCPICRNFISNKINKSYFG